MLGLEESTALLSDGSIGYLHISRGSDGGTLLDTEPTNDAAQRQRMGEHAGEKAEGGIRGIGCVRLQVYVLYPYFSMDQKAIIGVSRCP